MSIAKKRVGIYSPIINIIICIALILVVCLTLFGNDLVKIFSDSATFNFSSMAGYLPMSDEGLSNGVTYYVTQSGKVIEPQAIILQVIIYLSVISIMLSVLSIITGKKMGRWVSSLLVMAACISAIGFFIYSYGLSLDGTLWSDINAFFVSVFSIGLLGGVTGTSFGSFAVFTTYLLIAGFGVSSFLVSTVNK